MRCRERVPLNVAPLLAVEEMTITLVGGLTVNDPVRHVPLTFGSRRPQDPAPKGDLV